MVETSVLVYIVIIAFGAI